MASRTYDLLIKITPKNKESVVKAIKLLVDAHAINAYDVEDILDNIIDVETLERLDEIQGILDSIKIGEEKY